MSRVLDRATHATAVHDRRLRTSNFEPAGFPRDAAIGLPCPCDASHRPANLTPFAPSSKAHYIAREDGTSRAGAAYVFSRLGRDSHEAGVTTASSSGPGSSCPSKVAGGARYCARGTDRAECLWAESAKLTAGDRRGGDLFGATISVHHASGVAVVGAPGASLTGLWREVIPA